MGQGCRCRQCARRGACGDKTPITAVWHEVGVFRSDYMELLCSCATEVQCARDESKAAASKLTDNEAKIGELDLEMEPLADDVGEFGDLRKPFSVKEVEQASTKSVLETRYATLKQRIRECDKLSSELD